MYLMYGDQAYDQEGRGQKFFLYGGMFIDHSKAGIVHSRIEELRRKAGFGSEHGLKFASSTRPSTVSLDAHTEIKRAVIALAQEVGVTLCAYIFLQAIGHSRDQARLVEYGANMVLGRYNEFLTEKDQHGVAELGRLNKNGFSYAREKFQHGLSFTNHDRPLDRVISFGLACDGASHLSSMTDVLLGALQYCVNEPEKDTSTAMLPKLVPLMWSGTSEGKRDVRERGLNLRPKKVDSPNHQGEYDKLLDRLQGCLDRL